MKKTKYLIILLILLTSCAGSKQAKQKEEDWIFAFKAEVCASCFRYQKVNFENDISGSVRAEVLNFDAGLFKKTDSLGKIFSDSIDIKSRYYSNNTDFSPNSRVISNGCLSFFESKQLDKLAKKVYRHKK